MTAKCKHCGDDLTVEEIKEISDASMDAGYPAELVCNHCLWEMDNNAPEPDNFSDADPGL